VFARTRPTHLSIRADSREGGSKPYRRAGGATVRAGEARRAGGARRGGRALRGWRGGPGCSQARRVWPGVAQPARAGGNGGLAHGSGKQQR